MFAADQPHCPAPEDIMEYLDGEGVAASRAAIESHLASCAGCGAVAGEHASLSGRMHAWTVDRAPGSLLPPVSKAARFTAWIRQPRFAVVTFSAAAVVLVMISMSTARLKRELPTPAVPDRAPLTLPEQAAAGVPPSDSGRVAGRLERSSPAAAAHANDPAAAESVARLPMVIRTASLRLMVKDFAPARGTVEALVADAGGFIDRLTVAGDANVARELRGTLRVPGDRLAGVLARLRSLGAVLEDTQGSEDVTDQIVDLDARLASARATEQRLTDILKNHTGRLSDVLDVERELARVRLDIERLDAQKTNLARRVTYATIDVTIAEERKASIDGPLPLTTRLRLAALDGVENAVEALIAVLLVALRAGPTLALWGVFFATVWMVWRRRQRAA